MDLDRDASGDVGQTDAVVSFVDALAAWAPAGSQLFSDFCLGNDEAREAAEKGVSDHSKGKLGRIISLQGI